MTSALRRPLVAASLALFAVLLVLLVLSAVRVHQASDSVDRQSREAMNWIASQMEVEFWRFTQAVNRYEPSESPPSLGSISLRMDILWSRIRLFQSGDVGLSLSGLATIRQAVDRLDQEFRIIDRIFHEYNAQAALGFGPHAGELQRRLLPHLDVAGPLLREIAMEANAIGAKRWEELVARHRSLTSELLTLLGGVFLLGILLLVILVRQIREDRRREGSEKMEAVGRLAGGVAHEINNVLAIVSGFTELAQNALEQDQPVDRHLERIALAARRGQRISQDLLAFGRKAVGRDAVFDLRELLMQQEQLLAPLLGERTHLSVLVPGEPMLVQGDGDLMGQVIMNLAINARDAMPDGGTITLSASCKGPYATLVIKDQGLGMDAKTVRRIFEPFFTTKGPGKGTGLGLAIVYGAVTQIGGKIEVASELGKGTTFTLRLNLAKIESAQGRIAPLPSPIEHGGRTVLVVEDEPDLLQLMNVSLSSLGHRVLTASSGENALAIQERHDGPIHVLLSDIVMPGIRGTELANRIRAIRPETQVVLMTGYPGQNVGAADIKGEKILYKPIDFAELARTLRAAADEAQRTLTAQHKDKGTDQHRLFG